MNAHAHPHAHAQPDGDEEPRPRPGLGRRIAIAPIRGYQIAVSPFLGQRCKYHPSCSAYAVQAVEEMGVMKGLVLAGWRLLRCNPWSGGGVDYPRDQRLFRS